MDDVQTAGEPSASVLSGDVLPAGGSLRMAEATAGVYRLEAAPRMAPRHSGLGCSSQRFR
jgi:hypothetical protein